ncbi:MAG TPA: serine hydrolase [Armatimonadota bacterium]|nr:serine hydrolase [Armatimonadota bacterium]
MKPLTFLIPCALVVLAASSTPARVQPPEVARFERGLLPDSPIEGERGWRLADRMRRYRVPGLQVAVLTGERLAWTRGYGVADPGAGRRVTPDTLFDAGSVSKAVTAVAALKLVESGALSLDSPVNEQLRSWKLPENEWTRRSPVTLRRLLSHTAGVNLLGSWGYLEGTPLPTLSQVLDGAPPASNPPIRVEAEPGRRWRYSGGGYVIVQQLIEDATRLPFAEAMERTLFQPLGMGRSTFVQGLPAALRPDAAAPTSEAIYFKGLRLHPHAAAAGLYTTAPDLARLLEALFASLRGKPGAYLAQETARLLITPIVRDREPWDRAQPNRRNTQKDQALGLMLMSRGGTPGEAVYAYHDGLNAGFRARLIFNPETGSGAVLLCNYDGDEEFLLEATRALAGVYGWPDFLPAPIRPIRLSAAELDRYVGRYRRSPDNVVTLRRQGGRLIWTDLWTASQPIYPVGDHVFEHRELFGRPSRFTIDAEGRVAALDGWPRMDAGPLLPVEQLLRGNVKEGVELLRADASLDEGRLANIAFNLLQTHRSPNAAAAVYRVVTERFPGSGAAWEALGDALKKAGDLEGGRAAAERAAALRDFWDRLSAAFEGEGIAAGQRAYRALRNQYGAIQLGDLPERLARSLRERGKAAEAEAAARL